jgi:predicted Rossmann fold flavoprotein
VVIGAGPAGLVAAAAAAARGKSIVIVEKNNVPAKKLRITGKGRCNITNTADIQYFFNNINTNANFLYSALYSFTNEDTVNLFNSLGVKTKTERGGRVFPASDNAKDVADALLSYAKKHEVEIITSKAEDIIIEDKKTAGVLLADGRTISSDAVLIATGGLSYPATGSTGDGYKFAKKAGHSIITPKPSLVPLVAKEKWVSRLTGLSLKNVSVKLEWEGKVLYSDFGEMLFTHYGVSGPVILSASAHIKDFSKKVDLYIDLKPALTDSRLDQRLIRDFNANINKNFSNSLGELLPKKLIPLIVELSEINPQKKVNQITADERMKIVSLLKRFHLTITGTRPIEEAIITSGGVCTSEINPSTMESKLAGRLFFAGEVIDVDAYTGGYNLQIAFSTGYLAGKHI